MPIRFENNIAIFEDVCAVEESEILQGWLKANPHGSLDFSHCSHLHTAVLQVVLCASAQRVGPPSEPILSSVLFPRNKGTSIL